VKYGNHCETTPPWRGARVRIGFQAEFENGNGGVFPFFLFLKIIKF
jgi:hypothetical protein